MRSIRTVRLVLEPLEAHHASLLFTGLSDAALYEFLDEHPPESVEALERRYRRLAARISPDGLQAWLHWALRASSPDRYVGTVQATVHTDGTAHVAYVLFRDEWGRGFAREGVSAMIDHLRGSWSVRRVLATVDDRNRRSIALLRALGFRRVPRGNVSRPAGPAIHEVEFARSVA